MTTTAGEARGDFGHSAMRGKGLYIDHWGDGPFKVGRWSFEYSDRFGPVVLGKNGDPLANQPAEQSPFWSAFAMWQKNELPKLRSPATQPTAKEGEG